MKHLRNLHNYLYNLPRAKFILFIAIIAFFINRFLMIPIFLISQKLGHYNISGPSQGNIFFDMLFMFIIAPFGETLIFQKFVIDDCLKKFSQNKHKYYITIFISSAFFGLLHIVYEPLYSLSAFFTGLFLAYSYIVYKNKNDKPVLTTTLIHSILNMLGFALVLIF